MEIATNSLFTQITIPKHKISNSSATSINDDNNNKIITPTGVDIIHPSNLAKENSNFIFEAKYYVSMSNVEKRSENSILRSNYIVFEIAVTRSTDSEVHSIWKRYKELYAWYNDLLYELEEIEFNKAIEFPTYSESWIGGSSAKSDVNSDFVQKRRLDLQNFFNSLFCQYPKLFDHPKVMSLLELHRFSPEAKGSSIYSKPESYYDVYSQRTALQTLPSTAAPVFRAQMAASSSAERFERVAPSPQGSLNIVNFITATPLRTAPVNREPGTTQHSQRSGVNVGEKADTDIVAGRNISPQAAAAKKSSAADEWTV